MTALLKIYIDFFKSDLVITIGKYLLVVNKDVREKSKFTITFNSLQNIYEIDKDSGEKKFIKSKDNISLIISAGTGELFYIE